MAHRKGLDVPRPRQYEVESLLDHARRLWVRDGIAGVTVRALAGASGVSNGSIYNAFGSLPTLLAQVWIRQADEFLAFQRNETLKALERGSPQDAVVAGALAPAAYAERDEEGARLLLAVRPDDLTRQEVADEQLKELTRLRRDLSNLIVDLAASLWGRNDTSAVALIRICVVDLPGRLLLSRNRPTDPLSRHALEAAVRGITNATPPPNRQRSSNRRLR